jgi:hypothetical protein
MEKKNREFALLIGDMRRAAEADLAAAAGDYSLCVIARSGRSFPAVKYHEGRAAALAMVGRELHTVGISEAVAAAEDHFDRIKRLASSDPDWDAYRQGALDALDRLRNRPDG